jgi:Ca-activated chloride channel family protein
MTDDLDRLKAALQAAPPAADPAVKAAALARATENFDAHQENRDAPRPSQDRPKRAGVLTGVLAMLSNLTSRPALAATASVVALTVGLGLVLTHSPRPTAPLSPVVPAGSPVLEPAMPVTDEKSAERTDLRAQTPLAEAAPKSVADALVAAEPVAPPAPVTTGAANQSVARSELAAPDDQVPAVLAPSAAQPMAPARSAAEADSNGIVGAASRLRDAAALPAEPDTEAFANDTPNPLKTVADDPVSTFSIDVDTASYGVVRSSLTAGYLPPAEAVRIEEMVNYFPYAYPAPDAGEVPFKPTVTVVPTPWNPDTELVHIGIQGRMPALADRPPLNLVFLIDTSGSMQDANKLPLLKQSFRLMLGQLRPEDRVAIVTYAGSAGEVLEPTPASDRAAILRALDRLEAGGSTAGQEGLQQAYAVAEGMADDGEVTRILLATDGDFNVGISDPEALKTFIADKRKSGTYLSVLGFGRGNLDDATMQALAQNGNGTAAYIDTLSEAQKVLVDQLSGALFPIADDVKIQMEFNPAVIAEYRLIGYETRTLAREDFNNDRVDAGEIGAGVQVTALYEVTPVGSPAIRNTPLRYGTEASVAATAGEDLSELGFLKLRWKDPGAATSQLVDLPVAPQTGTAGDDTRFAIAVAGFGQLLTGATYLGDWGWDDVIALANGARGEDAYGYRAEAVQLMRLAQSLSGR